MSAPEPGLAHTIYLGGYEIVRDPSSFAPLDPRRLELAQYLMSGHLHVDILDVDACARPSKANFRIGWEELSRDEFDKLQRVAALARYVDFCPWLATYEAFEIAEGEPLAGVLSRREALDQVPGAFHPADTTDYVPVLWVDDVVTAVTLGAVDSYYRQAWAASGVGATGGSSCVIRFVALYRAWVTALPVDHQQPTRTRLSLSISEA